MSVHIAGCTKYEGKVSPLSLMPNVVTVSLIIHLHLLITLSTHPPTLCRTTTAIAHQPVQPATHHVSKQGIPGSRRVLQADGLQLPSRRQPHPRTCLVRTSQGSCARSTRRHDRGRDNPQRRSERPMQMVQARKFVFRQTCHTFHARWGLQVRPSVPRHTLFHKLRTHPHASEISQRTTAVNILRVETC